MYIFESKRKKIFNILEEKGFTFQTGDDFRITNNVWSWVRLDTYGNEFAICITGNNFLTNPETLEQYAKELKEASALLKKLQRIMSK